MNKENCKQCGVFCIVCSTISQLAYVLVFCLLEPVSRALPRQWGVGGEAVLRSPWMSFQLEQRQRDELLRVPRQHPLLSPGTHGSHSPMSSRLNLWFLQRPTVHLLVIALIFILLYFFMCLFVIIYFSFLIISLASHKQSISGTLSWIFHIRALFLVLSFTKYISKTYFSFDLFMKWLRINQHFEQIANSSKETLY